MFDRLFGRGSSATTHARSASPVVTEEGLVYPAPNGDAAAWLSSPFQFEHAADLGARLGQVFVEGFGTRRQGDFLLGWGDVYQLLAHPELASYQEALSIPPQTTARPRLLSRGALMDSDFSVLLDSWVDDQGRPLQPAPRLLGRVLTVGNERSLVPAEVDELLSEIASFHACPPAARSLAFKEQVFGRLRRLAKATGCPVSDYVERTVVLTPEKLQLSLDGRGDADGKLVEVTPGFEDAPTEWLSVFDRMPLQDSYDVPDGASLVRVVLTPEVKSVLAEVKAMPGRRVAGHRAQAFVRNPFAVLGDAAKSVIDAEQFEEALENAGIHFTRFTPRVERGAQGEVVRVALIVETLAPLGVQSEPVWLEEPRHLDTFVSKLDEALTYGAQCFRWKQHELEVVGESIEHLGLMSAWLREWLQPTLWTADEVLDISRYAERIEGFGEETPYVTPVIARTDSGNNWFEGNVTVGLKLKPAGGDEPALVPYRFDEVPSLEEAVGQAERQGQDTVRLPGLQRPVPLQDAKRAVAALAKAVIEVRKQEFEPTEAGGVSRPKKRLVVKRNLDEVDYNEERADSLRCLSEQEPWLPSTLRPEIQLKPHQLEGVAWLQHLWEASPDRCRGALLADDMGLGKTLQLLTFIAACFEKNPTLAPALVVAPVALLENWRQELERFFLPGTLPLLMLYGDSLKALRAGKHDVDAELRHQGVTRLLKKNWVGDAKLVLTTYETMRDLEFALAAQPWSVMVCDEAQKIKTPGAMVTRSAKKQQVRFRIACTGTPVENTLADLWCLFDFIQAGMLGALNHFSRTYRQPIEAKTPEQRAKVAELRALIEPQIKHRKKIDVAKDLPTPVEEAACKALPMSVYQRRLYDGAMRVLQEQRATNPTAQLQALMAIRKICSDPHGHAESDVRAISVQRLVNESPKLGWLVDLLKGLAARPADDHKVIVFCEFRELQLVLQRVIAAFFGFAPSIVNGDTTADPRASEGRQQLIDQFQRKQGFNVIILSPLAVGFGVNIQAANHVVHFTRTWNPAKEDQATARAYRIGQTRTVSVYYPGVVADGIKSFDQTLDELLGRKRALAADMLNGCSDLRVGDFAELM
ncbi:DEAD/DEAH box helicase [Inhella crocodyli]|uniref:DEAD/DEAH box helicase n=1 Tax=Inhella crocodyli TaxID=2499851 RepID=A0A3S2URA8_9BURK|nr:DEAD/DEAH box helicase [Inhella crocodyli]RVT82462.1 DEAD/DEAH box helicase [Inhella crocodyli]